MKRSARFIQAALWLTVLIILVKLLLAIVFTNQLQQTMATVQQTVMMSADSPESIYPVIRHDLQRVAIQTRQIKRAVWPLSTLFQAAPPLPIVDSDLANASHLLNLSTHLSTMFELLDPTVANLAQSQLDSETDLFGIALQFIRENQVDLVRVEQEFDAAETSFRQIKSPRNIQLKQITEQLAPLFDYGKLATPLLHALPHLLGENQPHHVLILFQNADELRPTGGFITSSAYLTIENGQITNIEALDSNSRQIDQFETRRYGLPPFPYREYMDLRVWLFRDANWSPDFPTSATKAATLYTYGRGVPVDTVISINQYTLEGLLEITGPVELADGQTVSAENVLDFIYDSWTSYYAVDSSLRKAFIIDFAPSFLDTILTTQLTSTKLTRLIELGDQNQWHLYSNQAPIQRVSEALGWDGSIPDKRTDYVYLVDMNVGYDKSNLNMQHELNYHVSLSNPLEPFGVLTVNYANHSNAQPGFCRPNRSLNNNDYIQRATNCNANYLRLYLPNNSELLERPYFPVPSSYYRSATGDMRPLIDERGKEVWGGLMVTAPQSRQTGRYVYTLQPDAIYQWVDNDTIQYSLFIQKQSGKRPHPLAITVDVPINWTLNAVESNYSRNEEARTIHYDVSFDRDFELELEFKVPSNERETLQSVLSSLAEDSGTPPAPRLVPTQPPVAFPAESTQ